MPLPLWIQRMLNLRDWQRCERARVRRYTEEIELSVLRLEDRRVLNASGVFDLAAAAPGDSGVSGSDTSAIAASESLAPAADAAALANPVDISVTLTGDIRLYREVNAVANTDMLVVTNGTQQQQTPWANVNRLTISGGQGDDTLTVDFTGGEPLPSGGIFFNGLGQAEIGDTLIVTGGDGFSHVVYNATDAGAGSLVLDGSTISFSGLEPIDVTPDAGIVTINIDPDNLVSGTIHSELTAGPASGQSTVSFDNGLESMTFSNPSVELVIVGDDNSDDVITFTSLDADFTAAITVDGGADDTTNLNGLNAAGSSDSPASLTINTESINLNASSITTSGDQIYNGAVLLTEDTALSGVNITFEDTLDGSFALLVSGSGVTDFQGIVGGDVPLVNLRTDAGGTTKIGANVTTTGDQSYDRTVQLTGDVILSGAGLMLDGGIAGNGNDLTLDFDGLVSQGAGITTPNLTLLGSGVYTLTNAGNDFETLAASTTDAVINVQDANDLSVGTIGAVTGITNVGHGDVTLIAAGTLTIGQPINNSQGGDTTLEATNGDLVINADLSNVGDLNNPGSVVGRAGADVLIAVGTIIQTHTGFIEVTSLNGSVVDPIVTLAPVDRGGSNVDSAGNASIEVTIPAPAGRNFEIVVDWGDGNTDLYHRPLDEPDDGSQVYTFHHRYTAHPDPINPADPIPVSVTVAFDGRTFGVGGLGNGIAFYRGGDTFISTTVADELTVPGDGVFGFIVIVKNQVEPVQLRRVRSQLLVGNQASVVIGQDNWLSRESGAREFSTITPARLFFRRVDSSGKEDDDVELDVSLLEEGLLRALARLPNGRYRVYYQEPNSERVRMVREVNVYQGRVVPPDFRSDVSERQPGNVPAAAGEREDAEPADQEQPVPQSVEPPSAAPVGGEGATQPPASPAVGNDVREDPAREAAQAAVAIGLVAAGGKSPWSEQVDRAYEAGRDSASKAARRHRRLRPN